MSNNLGTLGSLVVSLAADVVQFESDMGHAMHKANESMEGISKAAEMAKKALEVVGVGLGFNEFREFIAVAIEAEVQLGHMSEKLGISIENLAAYKIVAAESGTTMEGMAQGVKKLSTFMVEHSDRLKAAGITAKDANGALIELADIFHDMPDGVQKTALAVQLFGRSGLDMIPMLNKGSEELQHMIDKGKELNPVTEDMTKQAKLFEEQMVELKSASGRLANSLATELVTGLNKTIANFKLAREAGLDFFQAITGLGVRGINESIEDASKNAGKHIRELQEQVAKTNRDIASLKTQGYSTDDYDAELRILEKKLDYFKALQREAALAGVAPYRDEGARGVNHPGSNATGRAKELLGLDGSAAVDHTYDNLIKLIRDKEAEEAAALTTTAKLTEGEKLRAKIEAELADGTLDLTAKQKANVEANLDALVGIEKIVEARKAQAAAEKVVAQYAAENQQMLLKIQQEGERAGLSGEELYQQDKRNAAVDNYLKKIKEAQQNATLTDEARQQAIRGETDEFVKLMPVLDETSAKSWELAHSWDSGVKSAFNAVRDDATDAAAQAKKVTTDLFKGMEDALVNFAKTGKLDFKSLADSIITDLIRIQIQRNVMAPLVGSGQNGDNGILGSIGSGLAHLFGFATGGDFTVGGNGGTDTTPVAFMATPGETVSVRTPGQNAQQSSGAQPVTINFNVTTNDSKSFQQMMAQNQAVILGVVRQAFTKRAITPPI